MLFGNGWDDSRCGWLLKTGFDLGDKFVAFGAKFRLEVEVVDDEDGQTAGDIGYEFVIHFGGTVEDVVVVCVDFTEVCQI